MLNYISNSTDRIKAAENFDRALSGEAFIIEEEYGDAEMERRYYEDNYNPIKNEKGEIIGLALFLTDITARKKLEYERERLIEELQENLNKVKTLSGLLPICSNCKKVRNDAGYWNQIEVYIKEHSDAEITHGICPECARKLYPDFYKEELDNR